MVHYYYDYNGEISKSYKIHRIKTIEMSINSRITRNSEATKNTFQRDAISQSKLLKVKYSKHHVSRIRIQRNLICNSYCY